MAVQLLREVLLSADFHEDLAEISSCLASIMQERPIVYLVAKHLWKCGYKFELEKSHQDLFVNNTGVEFKFNFDRAAEVLKKELAQWDDLEQMWAKVKNKSWGVLSRIYSDICDKKPDVFVWIICSRDLATVADEDLERIAFGREQRKFNEKYPYPTDAVVTEMVDQLLAKLQTPRPFTVHKESIVFQGDLPSAFPSTYHFIICDFSTDSLGK